MGKRWLVPAGLAAAALIAAGCGSTSTSGSGSGGSGGSAGSGNTGTTASSNSIKTTSISGATVLTNAKGLTLYWFVPDTSTTSNCNGHCAKFWPPVKGPVQAGSGVSGTLGTITRSDGSKQATWNGHPLYTYAGDTAPGQNKGNGITIDGGLWHEVTLSGSPSNGGGSGGGGGGGGYGY
ncbi:MAG TPA: hypothetical protein VFQ44_23150 [Streptosporangiaceae bacterium]|nr:hypothetical protein [Streptosporangiaceae bacterium]